MGNKFTNLVNALPVYAFYPLKDIYISENYTVTCHIMTDHIHDIIL